MNASDTNERSRYWLSPGIDVPTRAEVMPGMRQARGLYISAHAAEAVFVPADEFMRMTPLWRLDVLGDIAEAIERTQRHAALDLFHALARLSPGATLGHRLWAFRQTCEQCGVDLPQNVEALLVLDHQFSARRPQAGSPHGQAECG